jgi:F-type H+-transporting ATPase subunit alpha
MPEATADPPADDSALTRQQRWLQDYAPALRVTERGRVVSVGDGIAWIEGLPSAAMDSVLDLADGSRALVFHLGRRLLGGILLYQTPQLTAGTLARLGPATRYLSIGVGDALLGRVIDPLGTALDGAAPPACRERHALDTLSPPITARAFVKTPLYTGSKVVDTMIPIGRGQRQLLIGDNGTGKTALALDAVINQAASGVRCVYALIGQKRSAVVNAIDTLREAGALAHTTMVVAEATALPGMKYLAPFAACAVAEGWMDAGHDTLIVYDDLTTHARTYRELSLLLERPPGREAYPGDIFYLHSRLLERATCLSASAGGGSMTALPIVETEQGEIAAYIPTNLISITDGQVYFDRDLFAAGVLPAVDVSRSVSRIGGNAQHPRIKQEAGRMKLDYLQFLELEVFTRFGTKLEAGIEQRIRRGRVLREILKQDRQAPVPVEQDLAWMIAFNEGLLDTVAREDIGAKLARLAQGVEAARPKLEQPREGWVQAVRTWLGDSSA